jgi:hypothetical protein
LESPIEKDKLEDTGLSGTVLLKYILEKYDINM